MTGKNLGLISKKGNVGNTAIFFVFIVAFLFILFLVNAVVDLGFDEINAELQSDNILDTEQKERLDDQYQTSKSLFDAIFITIIIFMWIISLVVSTSAALPNMFFWMMIILSIVGLVIAFPLANSYDDIVTEDSFSDFPTKYPKTDHFFNNLHIYVLAYFISILLAGFGGGRF